MINRLNAKVGKYNSVNMKIDWSVEDPVLYEIALKRIQEIEEKIQNDH